MKFISLLVGLFLMLPAVAAVERQPEDFRRFGENTQVEIYVFSSPACPHCATFHKRILPQIKDKFVDKGLARLTLVDVPGDKKSFQVSAIGRCLSDTEHQAFMERIYDNQAEWAFQKRNDDLITSYLTELQIPEASWKRCWENKKLLDTLLEQRNNMVRQYKVNALPTTIVVRGKDQKAFLGADRQIISEMEDIIEK